MNKKTIISTFGGMIRNLKVLDKRKEDIGRKLAVTEKKLSIKSGKLAVIAKKKEITRKKLLVTAKQLAVIAKERESIRVKLVVTAKKLVKIAKEKEVIRRNLAVTAEKLKESRETLEEKIIERTKALAVAKAKEEATLLSIGDGVIATDEKGNIILINKTTEKLLGLESEEVIGRGFHKAINIEDERGISIPLEKRPMSMALVAGTTTTTTTTTTTGPIFYVRKDGTRFPVAITVTPVKLNGKIIGTIEVFRDITKEKEIDKAKTEFVSLASHQLRTPLTIIDWYIEMLQNNDAGELNKKQNGFLSEIYKGSQRMVKLVNALLNVSRLELGTFNIEPEPTNLLTVAKSVIDEQKREIDIKRLNFKETHDELPKIFADPKLSRIIFENLLSNSIKYTPEKGKINLSLKKIKKGDVIDKHKITENSVLISVADTGYGIPKNQQDKIFTKLFRADNIREKDTEGNGLGLYIVKSIVGNSGGEIWFKSKKNKGTTFYVTLPLDGVRDKS